MEGTKTPLQTTNCWGTHVRFLSGVQVARLPESWSCVYLKAQLMTQRLNGDLQFATKSPTKIRDQLTHEILVG